MKLLINTPLTYAITFPPDISEEDWGLEKGFWDDMCDLLTGLGVYHSVDFVESGAWLNIDVQKCSLDEEAVNTLFYEVFELFTNKIQIKYSPLGSTGCDFALELSQPVKKNSVFEEV
jgi:hypothetical protein